MLVARGLTHTLSTLMGHRRKYAAQPTYIRRALIVALLFQVPGSHCLTSNLTVGAF